MVIKEQIKTLIESLSEEQLEALRLLINSIFQPPKKVKTYEEEIWDDWNDEEVDRVYGEMYRQLR